MKPHTTMPVIPHNRLTFGDAECEAVVQTVRSGHWAQGPKVRELEHALAKIAGVKYAVCVSSGLSALRLSLGALGVQPKDAVVIPAYCCVALANATLVWGAKPIAADVEPLCWNADPGTFRQAISEFRPRVVIAVSTFGCPAQLEDLGSAGVPVIEDCAHAFGIKSDGKGLGSRGKIGVLSFYATKLLGGGEGGAVLTNSRETADYLRATRDYGDQPAAAHRMNDKMNDLEASLVLAQLQRLPEFIAAREAIAMYYLERLSGRFEGSVFRLPAVHSSRVWYRFAVEMLTTAADAVVAELERFGVQAAIPVNDWREANARSAPVADRAYRSLVSLPLYPALTRDEQEHVVKSFLRVCEELET
jgi:perosamine synthetase